MVVGMAYTPPERLHFLARQVQGQWMVECPLMVRQSGYRIDEW